MIELAFTICTAIVIKDDFRVQCVPKFQVFDISLMTCQKKAQLFLAMITGENQVIRRYKCQLLSQKEIET